MRIQVSHLLLVATLGLSSLASSAARGSPLDSSLALKSVDLLRSMATSAMDLLLGAPRESRAPPDDKCLDSACNNTDPDRHRTVAQIIESRGFRAQEFDVVTRDGYILTIQRIVNPLVSAEQRANLRPVIMQHGLMSSSVDWVINSPHVRPSRWPRAEHNGSAGLSDTQQHPNSLGFYLANRGYDVFLANSRGNSYGRRHTTLSEFDPRFWAFTFDEQIEFDLPDTIEFVLELTNNTKLGYVGHSQGTLMMFGLLSERPAYADVVEPFVALAPVAYCSNTLSPVKYFSVYTPLFQHVDMVFAPPNAAVTYLAPLVCSPELIRKEVCANIVFLATGFDWAELDETRINAYLAHMPSGTSVKNIAHYGQMVLSGRFAHFNHGILANQLKYGQTSAPDYDLAKIRSKSIALFVAQNDWLAAPKDVARLRAALKVEPFAVYNMSELVPKWNHIDFVYAKHAGELINPKIEQVFEHFK